jgi:hypothetical protein
MNDQIKKQKDEFDALNNLISSYEVFKKVPIVDDYYPEARHDYERSLDSFINSLKENGRLEQNTIAIPKYPTKKMIVRLFTAWKGYSEEENSAFQAGKKLQKILGTDVIYSKFEIEKVAGLYAIIAEEFGK